MHRYAKLGYIALNVSDTERSRNFYETLWGLEHTETGASGEMFFRCSDDHHNLVIYKSATPGLKRIGWEMESEADLDKIASVLEKNGQKVREVPAAERTALRQGRSIRFSDPFTGVTHEYYADQYRLGGRAWKPTVAKIQRLGHIVLKTPRYQEALAFYMDVLNYRVSDQVENYISFMRCFPNPFHHSVGLASSKEAQFHHMNFMVTEVDDIGKGLWRFKKNDVTIVRGPGRHPPSGSMFLYVLDPDGFTVEYSFGMEEFPEVEPRRHRVLPPGPESGDFWGAPTDPRMGAFGPIEVEQAAVSGKVLQTA